MNPALPLVLTIAGGVVYHLCQKAAGGGGSPWPVLATAYGVAFATAVLLWWLFPARAPVARNVELAGAALIGLAALAIEAGFFLAYRAGLPIGTTALLSNLAVTAVLAAVGALMLGESLTLTRAGGALIAALGAWLIVRG